MSRESPCAPAVVTSRAQQGSPDTQSFAVPPLQERYEYLVDDPKWQPDWLSHEQLEALRSDLDARQAVEAEFKQLLEDQHVRRPVADACSLPLHLVSQLLLDWEGCTS